MYKFWYGYVKTKYGDKAKLEYMDTDSFIFQVEQPDIFALNGDVTIGLFKDECSGNVIKESIHQLYQMEPTNRDTKELAKLE